MNTKANLLAMLMHARGRCAFPSRPVDVALAVNRAWTIADDLKRCVSDGALPSWCAFVRELAACVADVERFVMDRPFTDWIASAAAVRASLRILHSWAESLP